MSNRNDQFQRQSIQMRKNLEMAIEQMVDRATADFSNNSEDEQIFNGKSVKLYIDNQYIELPKALLEINNLNDVIQIFIENEKILNSQNFVQLFTPEEQQHLLDYLPPSLSQQQRQSSLNELLDGQCFHFGSPLEDFMKKANSGFFTKNRENCDRIDKQISMMRLANNKRDLLVRFENQNYIENITNRIRQKRVRQRCYEVVDVGGIKKARINFDLGSTDTNSTSSSQSEEREYQPLISQVQQVQQVPLNLMQTQQSLFPNGCNLALPQLPAYTSTSLLTNQMTLASLQVRRQLKKVSGGPTSNPNGGFSQSKMKLESTVPTGQSDREWLDIYRKQEGQRYLNPLQPYTFTCIDGSHATVAPAAKKLLCGLSSKPRQHELLRNERPPYVTILSLVRDAAARLPKGYGTRADIMNLVKDSQYVNENLPEEKMSSIISGALDRLHQSSDPCVKYDQEKKIWIYLHHDRDVSYPEWQIPSTVVTFNSVSRSKKPKQETK